MWNVWIFLRSFLCLKPSFWLLLWIKSVDKYFFSGGFFCLSGMAQFEKKKKNARDKSKSGKKLWTWMLLRIKLSLILILNWPALKHQFLWILMSMHAVSLLARFLKDPVNFNWERKLLQSASMSKTGVVIIVGLCFWWIVDNFFLPLVTAHSFCAAASFQKALRLKKARDTMSHIARISRFWHKCFTLIGKFWFKKQKRSYFYKKNISWLFLEHLLPRKLVWQFTYIYVKECGKLIIN